MYVIVSSIDKIDFKHRYKTIFFFANETQKYFFTLGQFFHFFAFHFRIRFEHPNSIRISCKYISQKLYFLKSCNCGYLNFGVNYQPWESEFSFPFFRKSVFKLCFSFSFFVRQIFRDLFLLGRFEGNFKNEFTLFIWQSWSLTFWNKGIIRQRFNLFANLFFARLFQILSLIWFFQTFFYIHRFLLMFLFIQEVTFSLIWQIIFIRIEKTLYILILDEIISTQKVLEEHFYFLWSQVRRMSSRFFRLNYKFVTVFLAKKMTVVRDF